MNGADSGICVGAGGPGDSKADLNWLDQQLSVFFGKHGTDKLKTHESTPLSNPL